MCIDRKSFTFCKCIHITKLIYIVYVTTAITHTVPILFLLFYAQWLALIVAAIIAIAHIFFAVAIHKESYRLLVIFIVYQCGAVIALIALDIWALIIMEMFPGTSIFAENCRKTNPTNYNECVRLKAAILGGVTLADTIINLAFVAPVLKSYFIFLRESPISPSSTAKISRFSAPGIGDAALDRERYFGSVDVPYFRKFSANPQQGPFRAQPFTVYAPLRDPLALGDTGLPQQYANPTTGNSAYTNPAGTLYQQQNPLFVSRMPDDKELTAQQSYLPGGNSLYAQVSIPKRSSAQEYSAGFHSTDSSEYSSESEPTKKYSKRSSVRAKSSTTSQRYPGYDTVFDRKTSADPYILQDGFGRRDRKYSRDIDQPYRSSDYSRSLGRSRYSREDESPSMKDQRRNFDRSPYAKDTRHFSDIPDNSRDFKHSRFDRRPSSDLQGYREPPPDY